MDGKGGGGEGGRKCWGNRAGLRRRRKASGGDLRLSVFARTLNLSKIHGYAVSGEGDVEDGGEL